MSRIPIASLANGVLFATQSFASPSNPSGVPVLTPAVGTQCFVYIHDTATPAAIWTDELGSVPLAQPLTTSASGTVPGWIDTSLLPLDLIVALPSGNATFVLAGGGSGGGGGGAVGSVFGRTGSIVAQTGDYTAAQVGADAAGAAGVVSAALSTETSRATTAEALKAPLASPALTGTPTAPTPTARDNSTKLATTAYADAVSESIQTIAAASTAQTLTLPTAGKKTFDLTASAASCAISLAGATAGVAALATVVLRQDATGGRAWTFPTNVNWSNGQLPPFSQAPNSYDVVTFLSTNGGTSWVASLAGTAVTALAVASAATLAAAPSNSSVALTWNVPNPGGAPITSWTVLRSTTTGAETALVTGLAAGSTSYTDNTAVNGTNYFYEVQAVSAAGNGTLSNEVAAQPASSGFVDSSSNGLAVTSQGSPTLPSKATSTLTGFTGGNMVVLPTNATTQAGLKLPSNFSFGGATQPWTVECAFARTRAGVQEWLVAKWSGAGAASNSGNYFGLFISASNFLSATAWAPNNTQIGTITGSTAITDTAFHWARMVFDGTTLYLFLDGGLQTSQGAHGTGLASPDTVTPVMIGGQNAASSPFIGNIDEVRLSNIARSTSAYTVPSAPFTSDANTLALLHMD